MTAPTTGPPEGCPKTWMYGRGRYNAGLICLHMADTSCEENGCTPVMIHPQRTGEEITRLRAALEARSPTPRPSREVRGEERSPDKAT